MRTTQYRALMECLDAADDMGYDIEELSSAIIFEIIIDETGSREWEDVPLDEIHRAIDKWKERTYE